MLLQKKKGWELPESRVTPESVALGRRDFVRGFAQKTGLAAVATAAATAGLAPGLTPARLWAQGRAAPDDDPVRGLVPCEPFCEAYPPQRNQAYQGNRPLTDEEWAASYCNFYEFGTSKNIAGPAQKLELAGWEIAIDGLVRQPRTYTFEDLFQKHLAAHMEQRIYRHRCVEAWAMTLPWDGVPFSRLLELAEPKPEARFVAFETQTDSWSVMPGLSAIWYPWPYQEGLTLQEAANELTFLATGSYGHPLRKQNGAPIRLVVPWKYGFKSIKSIVRIHFTDEQPVSFWQKTLSREYGFWANVNPDVPHPRWSQAAERLLGEEEKVPTQLYNGYEPYVAGLYADIGGGQDPVLFR